MPHVNIGSLSIVLLPGILGKGIGALHAVLVSQHLQALSSGRHEVRDAQRSVLCIILRLTRAVCACEEVPWQSWLAPAVQVQPLHVQKDSSQAGVAVSAHDALL